MGFPALSGAKLTISKSKEEPIAPSQVTNVPIGLKEEKDQGLALGGDGFPIGSLVILCSLVEIVSGNRLLGQTSKFVKECGVLRLSSEDDDVRCVDGIMLVGYASRYG
ncbi:hypothetical protein U1Q18_009834 [Sarracenia purpurea var. burkii]